jgi:hypothetical protein
MELCKYLKNGVLTMGKQELLEQEQNAFFKYRQYDIEGKVLLAKYWERK